MIAPTKSILQRDPSYHLGAFWRTPIRLGKCYCPLSMQGEQKERWMELCAQAAVEQDPTKLMELVKEINNLLEEKERRLGIIPPNS